MSVGDVALFTETYKSLLLDTIKVLQPGLLPASGRYVLGRAFAEHVRPHGRTLAEGHDEIAAVIIEPLIQGAGGMRMYHPVYSSLLREACDRYGCT